MKERRALIFFVEMGKMCYICVIKRKIVMKKIVMIAIMAIGVALSSGATEVMQDVRNSSGSLSGEAMAQTADGMEKKGDGKEFAVAPNFSLPNLDGEKVSLSSFKGKWVILDFWGSWCGWCIKGFPALKDAYKRYGDKCEIVGIDCGDNIETWKGAVKKYELPWVQLYNGEQAGGALSLYGIEGFPTKIIITPDEKVYDKVVGENPEFYMILDRALGGTKESKEISEGSESLL